MIDVDLPDGPGSPLVRSFAACLSSVTEVPLTGLPQPPDDTSLPHALATWKSWLAGRGSGLVPIADPRTFSVRRRVRQPVRQSARRAAHGAQRGIVPALPRGSCRRLRGDGRCSARRAVPPCRATADAGVPRHGRALRCAGCLRHVPVTTAVRARDHPPSPAAGQRADLLHHLWRQPDLGLAVVQAIRPTSSSGMGKVCTTATSWSSSWVLVT